jgi:hypothetical protein
MKVAINRCFGGFGISDEAFEKLLDRKGIAFDKVEKESSFLGRCSSLHAARLLLSEASISRLFLRERLP